MPSGCNPAKRRSNVSIQLIACAAIAAASSSVGAADFTDTAPVLFSTPIVERVTEPRQECTSEQVPAEQPTERSVVARILGGFTGAVVGRQVGAGSGRDVATGAGAVAGDRVANSGSDRSYTGAVVGGVAGAIIGNQVGRGPGNAAATAVGAIAGAMIGDCIDNARTA